MVYVKIETLGPSSEDSILESMVITLKAGGASASRPYARQAEQLAVVFRGDLLLQLEGTENVLKGRGIGFILRAHTTAGKPRVETGSSAHCDCASVLSEYGTPASNFDLSPGCQDLEGSEKSAGYCTPANSERTVTPDEAAVSRENDAW